MGTKALLGKLRLVPLPFLGFGLYRTWIYAVFMDPRITLSVVAASPVFHGTTAICSILFALFSGKIGTLSSKKWATPAAAGAMSLCALGNGLAGAIEEASFLLFPSAVIGGVGVSMIILLWSELFSCFNPPRIALYYSGSLLVGELCTVLFAGYCREYLVIASILLPAALGLCHLLSIKKIPESDIPHSPIRGMRNIPWKLMCLVAIFSFVYGYVSFSLPTSTGREVITFSMVSLVVAACVLCEGKLINFESAYRFALPALIFLPIMASLILSDEARASFSSVSYVSASTLSIIVICGISYRTGVSVLPLCGLERGLRYFARFAGLQAAMHDFVLLPNGGLGNFSSPLFPFALLIAAFCIVFSERNLFSRWGMPASSPSQNRGDESTDAIQFNIQGIGEAYGLTMREQEVLELLIRKKSTQHIADDLFIAPGTVKAHIQHIYVKLDVHSRDELYRMIGIDKE